jgi:gluconokinase
MNYIIGTDIGTTSTKSVVFTRQGEVVAKHSVSYPLSSPVPGAAEQNPEEIFAAVIQTIRQAIASCQPGEICCLSFSAAMHSLIAVDAEGKPLTPSLTWADNRSARWAEWIGREQHGWEIYRRTGTPIHPMSPFVKLVWLRHEHPELFEKAAKFISIKEYVFYRLFQQYVVDRSLAAATGLLNLNTLTWDTEALDIAGIAPTQLSEVVPTTHILQPMGETWEQAMGVPADTPVVIGASDGVLSNLGVGAMAPGVVAVTVGTSGAVRAVAKQPSIDPQGRLFCYPLTEQHWVVGGAVNNGGIVWRWVRDCLAEQEVATAEVEGKEPYARLMELAQTVPPGAEGLIFHPYLQGERSPLWDANARGSFFGLSTNHGKAHLLRAVLEGIALNLLLVLRGVEEVTGKAQRIQATGGLTRAPLWRQIMADVFERMVSVPEQYESSCLGAAVLGRYALGEISELAVGVDAIGKTYEHQPIPTHVEIYQQISPLYERLLQCFQGEYARIAELQTRQR